MYGQLQQIDIIFVINSKCVVIVDMYVISQVFIFGFREESMC